MSNPLPSSRFPLLFRLFPTLVVMVWLVFGLHSAHADSLGTTNLLVSSAAGSNSVVLGTSIVGAAWTATANASWLHLDVTYQSGTGSTNVIFSYDANTDVTRSGTLTIDGQNVTVTQVGSTYVAANGIFNLVTNGLATPIGLAVDGAGNVYVADSGHNAIKKWTATNNMLSTLVSTGLNEPYGVALDGVGDIYFTDYGNGALKEWTAANGIVSTITSFAAPKGLAVDGSGNVYLLSSFYDFGVSEWNATNETLTSLIPEGSGESVALDAAGNIYFDNANYSAITEWVAASGNSTNIAFLFPNEISGVTADGSGNVFFDRMFNGGVSWICDVLAIAPRLNILMTNNDSSVTTGVGIAVDQTGNIYFANGISNSIIERTYAFVDPTTKSESAAAGSDSLPPVLPTTENLSGPFAPTSDSSWLTISGVAKGVVSFNFAANPFFGSRIGHLNVLGQSIAITQAAAPYVLGTTNLLVGPAAGSNSVVLGVNPVGAVWTATTNTSWLHLSPAFQSGAGSTNVIFSFDANGGTTRSGSLTIAGQTVTVTQAGSTYVLAGTVTNLASSLNPVAGVAVDSAGNVYYPNLNGVNKWVMASNTVSSVISAGLTNAWGIAVDSAANVYVAVKGDIVKWSAATKTMTNLVSSGLGQLYGLALDEAGNVYAADDSSNTISQWTVGNNTLTSLVSTGLVTPQGLALDAAGNIYIANQGSLHGAIEKWTAADGNATSMQGIAQPVGVALDGSGNVYYTASGYLAEWNAANNTLNFLMTSTLPGGPFTPKGVAVDGTGNIYFTETFSQTLKELPRAFVDSTPRSESPLAGNDSLPVVLPATENLLAPFKPASDSTWLTITKVTNGIVSFSFTNNATGTNRTAHINLLGQSIPITQIAPTIILGTTNLLIGSTAPYSSSVTLAVNPAGSSWTATANASWLNIYSPPNGTYAGSTNVVFSYVPNAGGTRTNTITIAGHTVNITQAGTGYVAANPVVPLVSTGLNQPYDVAVDGSGNVYIADTYNSAIKKWSAANNAVTTLVSTGLDQPFGVTVDGSGNVYIADSYNNAIKEWSVTNNTVTTLVSTGLNLPAGVAMDRAGNVYIADSGNFAVKEWVAASNTVVTLVAATNYVNYLALDVIGNVYFSGNIPGIQEWNPANDAVTTPVSLGYYAAGTAVDGSGNIYLADFNGSAVREWGAVSHALTTLASGISQPAGIAVDAAENIYIANPDPGADSIEEIPHTFVNPSTRSEGAAAGSDALPPVLPTSANLSGPFTPTSDSAWLTISGVTGGVVTFNFTSNNIPISRTGHINLLGLSIPVTQAGLAVTPPVLGGFQWTTGGGLQFSFTNNSSATFSVWTATNLALPFTNWTMIGAVTNMGSGEFEFGAPSDSTDSQRFYRVSSP
jgi:sugar lactone lactonase YvrE